TSLRTPSKHISMLHACVCYLTFRHLSLLIPLLPCGVQPLPNLASPVLTVSMETYSLVAGYSEGKELVL
ncbi:hypothetical protein ABG768_010469, partial [Culter alburnus]